MGVGVVVSCKELGEGAVNILALQATQYGNSLISLYFDGVKVQQLHTLSPLES